MPRFKYGRLFQPSNNLSSPSTFWQKIFVYFKNGKTNRLAQISVPFYTSINQTLSVFLVLSIPLW
jgi:hypothetical protein